MFNNMNPKTENKFRMGGIGVVVSVPWVGLATASSETPATKQGAVLEP